MNGLLQDANIDGGYRVSKQSVAFKLFRTFRKKIGWSPLFCDNGAFLYDFDEYNQKPVFFKNILQQASAFKESVGFVLLDHAGGVLDDSEGLWKDFGRTTSLGKETPLESVLESLVVLRDEIKRRTLSEKILEAPNRKLLMVFLNLDDDDMTILNRSTPVREMMSDLLMNSRRERIYVFVLARHPERLPKKIMDALQWVAFIDEASSAYCQKIHPNIDIRYNSLHQLLIGMVYSSAEKKLIPIHPLQLTPSVWRIERDKKLKLEDAAYEKYLETLDDGE